MAQIEEVAAQYENPIRAMIGHVRPGAWSAFGSLTDISNIHDKW